MESNEPLLTQELASKEKFSERERAILTERVGTPLRDALPLFCPSAVATLLRDEFGVAQSDIRPVFDKHRVPTTYWAHQDRINDVQKFDQHVLPVLKDMVSALRLELLGDSWIFRKRQALVREAGKARITYEKSVMGMVEELLGSEEVNNGE